MAKTTKHIFIIGAKGLGNYGGYETFIDKLTEYHQDVPELTYHIACKANGKGHMDETILTGYQTIDKHTFMYHGAECNKLEVPEKIGPAQAIYYDIAALKYYIGYCKEHQITEPIFYILACRIGPFIKKYARQIHELNGVLYVNPDGHEWKRAKWSLPVRNYWKLSEKLMVKHADLLVCDSINIEKYIQSEYRKYQPKTTFIAYGSDVTKSILAADDETYINWLQEHHLKVNEYYLVVGRFVPENNFEAMIREFMKSKSNKDLAIITTEDQKFYDELENKLHFSQDKRIKFVGTVYNQELLKKIREDAYGYLHGHSVGGTNPSLLEALSSTKLNLLLNVGFNKEVGADSAIYWGLEDGSLATVIDEVNQFTEGQIESYNQASTNRIIDAYSWQLISDYYKNLFINGRG